MKRTSHLRPIGIVIFWLIALSAIVIGQKAEGCEKVDKSEVTIWGWIMENNPKDGGIVERLFGHVQVPDGTVLAGALVEVFDNPDLPVNKRKRLVACRTGVNGFFRFKNVPPGRYEIRASYGAGFDAGQTIVTLAPKDKNASTKDIVVRMEISQ